MSCCAAFAMHTELAKPTGLSSDELRVASSALGEGLYQSEIAVPLMHCAACMQVIEQGLLTLPGVVSARANLSTRRVTVRWAEPDVPPLVAFIESLGYAAHMTEEPASARNKTLSDLLLAVGVAGFATGNIMLLSVSIWSGAEGATRDLFHWVSALVAIPVIAYSGRIFFRSAWNALRHGRMNMDVPIVIGVSLAYATSLYETITHGEHAYFDASVSLLFFLLIGRTLDHVMRDRARAAVSGLVRLSPRGAVRLRADGGRDYIALSQIEPGMDLVVRPGDRIPVNATVVEGISELDCSLATGESAPRSIRAGSQLLAGTHNLSGALVIRATAAAKDSFLAEMVGLMEAAEQGRGIYRRLADRASALYSPVVHLTALLTFIGWMAATGDWHHAITVATAVLIITCPCALGLAVPIVQVMAARRLFERGIMMKDGGALERLAEIHHVVFDKTGTLTMGIPELESSAFADPQAAEIAVALARASSHPYSKAIVAGMPLASAGPRLESLSEQPGFGVEAVVNGALWRLGKASWVSPEGHSEASGTVLGRDGVVAARFAFSDKLRSGASRAVQGLREQGVTPEILSGDTSASVGMVASSLRIERAASDLLPAEKVRRLQQLAGSGTKTLMVGDGINDAPAMMAAHVSMAPATAADIGRNAADFVFLHESLDAVPHALDVAGQAERLVKQNFALAVGYNVLAVPLAIMGHVTPLLAALAMSGSSILVIANAMRLGVGRIGPRWSRRSVGTPVLQTSEARG
ncbi:cation-translocating P-type ATPase [Rhizobium sp. Leaf341]|uniref:cation-translocating P-type ATPase n=1 Tax=Rhizobium sp. Leaf341 TaxID=1736344 RepID=UPI000714BD82|nr:cation-translocating P-type ATPase [Rhizobium sp. Leaf341]KQR69381.1 nitrogen fixation protein FixI [Rhizobium sp. Leaf341]